MENTFVEFPWIISNKKPLLSDHLINRGSIPTSANTVVIISKIFLFLLAVFQHLHFYINNPYILHDLISNMITILPNT